MLLKSAGMNEINIYSNKVFFILLLVYLNLWKSIGFGSVLFLSSIMGLDQNCIEAAKVDGANIYQKIWYIILPGIKPTAILLLILGISGILRGNFDMFYQIVGNATQLYDVTDIIDTFVFRALVGINDFGMSSAGGLVQSVFCFIIVMSVNSIIRKTNPDYAIF